VKTFHLFKLSLFILTFFITHSAHCYPQLTQQEIAIYNTVKGFLTSVGGAALLTYGLLRIYNIPLTSTQEIALALQEKMSKKNLEKLYLGRKILGSFAIGGGVSLAIGGLFTMINASKDLQLKN